MARARSLTPEENERVCDAVRALMKSYSSQQELAAALILPDGTPASQAAVSVAVRGAPVGLTFARAVAARLGLNVEELLSGQRGKPDGGQRYEELQGWVEAAEQVIAEEIAPRYAVVAAGRNIVSFPVRGIDKHFVYDQAMLWLKYAPLETRRAAEKADALAARSQRLAREDERQQAVGRSGTVATTGEDDEGVAARPARGGRR